MYKAGEKIRVDDIVFCVPGLVIGFNSTILPGIEDVRRSSGLDRITLYIETWDDVDNMPWVNAIKEQHKDFPNITLKLNLWKHKQINFPELWRKIYTELGIEYKEPINVNPNLFKRLVPLVIYQKLYSRIHSDITIGTDAQDLTGYKNIPIFRIKPECIFKSTKNIEVGFMPSLIKDLSSHFIQFSPIAFKNVKSPFDIFYNDHITSHSLNDIFYFSSAEILYRTFGTSTNDIVDKFITLTRKYLDLLPFKVRDLETFGVVATNQEYYALEGSVLLKDLVDLNTSPVKRRESAKG